MGLNRTSKCKFFDPALFQFITPLVSAQKSAIQTGF
jgi:hypothetical protein